MRSSQSRAESRPGGGGGPERPAGLLARLGALSIDRRWSVIAATVLLTALAAVLGADVADRLSNGGYTPADSQAAETERVLGRRFSVGTPDLVLVVTAEHGVDAPRAAASGARLERRVRSDPAVRSVLSYFSTRSARLRSGDGRRALLLVALEGDENQAARAVVRLLPTWRDDLGPLRLDATGEALVNVEIAEIAEQDLTRAELIAAPVTALILVVVFGGLVAACLPVLVGAVAATLTIALLSALAQATSVSVFALNLTTALGFGLAVDYSLFVLARYREELANGSDRHHAIVASVATAGRTVVFSAITVSLSLSALLIFPLGFLRSMAYAAIPVVLLAALAAVTVLPAVLAVLGGRVGSGRAASGPLRFAVTRGRSSRPSAPRADGLFWERIARGVLRRPVLVTVPVLAVLLLTALPFAGVRFGLADHRVLPASAEAHRTADSLERDFARNVADGTRILLEDLPVAEGRADPRVLAGYARAASQLTGVDSVDGPTGTFRDGQRVAAPETGMLRGSSAWLRVWPSTAPFSARSEQMVEALRALSGPGVVGVTGPSATLVDTKATLADRLPWALGMIALSTFVLLFWFTGSLLIPVKALVLNLLSLTASFGAAVVVFQEGHLRGLVGDFTATGYLETTIPVLVFCIAFGLSMDYEVFLLSRIREEYVRTGDTDTAVVHGIRRTGRVFTAAAMVVAFVLGVLATSSLSLLKLLGVTLALAVLIDALLVRGVLVPAFMRLLGRANWWAPGPLRRLHDRSGLKE